MRLVMVSPDAPPEPNGGLGTYLDGLLGAMAVLDVRVDLVATSRDAELPRVSREGGVAIHRVLAERPWLDAGPARRMLGMSVEYARLNAAAVLQTARHRRQVDAVVVHDWMCAPAGLLADLVLRVPVVYHVHSAETFIGEGADGPVAWAGRLLNRVLSRRARLVVTPSYDTIAEIPHLARREDVVAISHGAGKALQLAVPEPAERVAVRAQVRNRYGVPDGRRLIVFSGRYAAHKGVYELIDAIPLLIAAGLDVGVIMSGSGIPDVAIDDRLRSRVAERGLDDRLQVLGRFLPMGELRDLLVAADVCAFPSTYEPFGFMALEAMALESRVVCGPGFDPDVVGSEAGASIRAPAPTAPALAEALALALDPAWGPDLAQTARRYVVDHHSWAAAAERTLAAYAQALGS